MFKGKRILFIGTGFYDYEKSIQEQFEKRGFTVFYFASDCKTNKKRILKMMGLNNLAIRSMSSRLTKLIEEQPQDIDYIFIIKGGNFSLCHFKQLKKKYPFQPRILYLWDSISNLDNWDLLRANFKNILTFDRKDAIKQSLGFRPLFFRDNHIDQAEPILYDVSFVAKAYPNRDKIVKQVKNQLDSAGLSYRFILIKTKLRFFIERYITHKISKKDVKLYSFRPIAYSDYLKISLQSNVIFDIPDAKQNGLTMRTIETIGLGKKIMTTNRDIEHYDLDKISYRLLDAETPTIDIEFLRKRNEVHYDYEKYKLSSFVDDILAIFQ